MEKLIWLTIPLLVIGVVWIIVSQYKKPQQFTGNSYSGNSQIFCPFWVSINGTAYCLNSEDDLPILYKQLYGG